MGRGREWVFRVPNGTLSSISKHEAEKTLCVRKGRSLGCEIGNSRRKWIITTSWGDSNPLGILDKMDDRHIMCEEKRMESINIKLQDRYI